jgi:hypothetical protein
MATAASCTIPELNNREAGDMLRDDRAELETVKSYWMV